MLSNEIEYKKILAIHDYLSSVENKTIEQQMTLKGCVVRLVEIKSQVNAINKVKIIPTKKVKSINNSTTVSPKLRCEVEPIGYSSDNNIIARAKFTKGKNNKMNVLFNVFVGDMDANGQCLTLQRPDRLKGNCVFEYTECRPLMDKAFAEYDWCLYRDDVDWI